MGLCLRISQPSLKMKIKHKKKKAKLIVFDLNSSCDTIYSTIDVKIHALQKFSWAEPGRAQAELLYRPGHSFILYERGQAWNFSPQHSSQRLLIYITNLSPCQENCGCQYGLNDRTLYACVIFIVCLMLKTKSIYGSKNVWSSPEILRWASFRSTPWRGWKWRHADPVLDGQWWRERDCHESHTYK